MLYEVNEALVVIEPICVDASELKKSHNLPEVLELVGSRVVIFTLPVPKLLLLPV